MADQTSTTGIQISRHPGNHWFLSVQECFFYKWSKCAITHQVNFLRIEETKAKHTIEKLKMKILFISECGIEYWGDREVLRADRVNKTTIEKLKRKEAPNG